MSKDVVTISEAYYGVNDCNKSYAPDGYNADVMRIKEEFKRTTLPDRFDLLYRMADLYMQGSSKSKAYMTASQCTQEEASKNSGSVFRGKCIQKIIRAINPDEDTLYIGEVKEIIRQGMAVIVSTKASARDKAEMARAMAPYIKAEKSRIKDEDEANSEGDSLIKMVNIVAAVNALAKSGKMVDQNQEIIDVEFLD